MEGYALLNTNSGSLNYGKTIYLESVENVSFYGSNNQTTYSSDIETYYKLYSDNSEPSIHDNHGLFLASVRDSNTLTSVQFTELFNAESFGGAGTNAQQSVSFSDDGKLISYHDGGMVVSDADGEVIFSVEGNFVKRGILSPDGKYLAYEDFVYQGPEGYQSTVFLANVDTGHTSQISR